MPALRTLVSLAATVLLLLALPTVRTAPASPRALPDPPVSSVSFFINCQGSNVTFSLPSVQSSCSQNFLYGRYSGIAQSVGNSQKSWFYVAGGTGKLNVTYKVVDVTTSKTLFAGAASGSISGGTCSSPSVVSGSSAVSSSTVLNPGDVVELSLTPLLIGSGSLMFCSGGSYASGVSATTTPLTGGSTPLLTTTLSHGIPRQSNIGGYAGVSIWYVNAASEPFTVLVYAAVRTGSGVFAGLVVSSITISPGQNVTAFVPLRSFSSGSYSVDLIALTTGGVPLSSVALTQVSV